MSGLERDGPIPSPAGDDLDDRLRDALPPAGAPLPPGLLDETLAAVRATRQASGRTPRLRVLATAALGLAGLAVVAVLAAPPTTFAPGPSGLPGATATPAGPSSTSGPATPRPTAPAYPAEAFGRPVITVAKALERRDADAAAAPGTAPVLAVGGWYSPAWGAMCPWPGLVDRLEARCPEMFGWLMDEPEDLLVVTANSATGRSPTGPGLNPRFLPGIAQPLVPRPTGRGPMPDPAPVPVVLLGHWGDGRAAYCTDEGAAACAREFVVDGVAWELDDWRDPVAYAESPTLGEPPSRPSAEAAAARARSLSEGGLVASIARSDAADWLTMDPRIAGLGELRLAGSGWFVRLVGPGPGDGSRTVILVDGDAGMRELPAWPTRVPAADRVAASTIRDGAGRPLRCDGVTVDACRAAAAAVRAADPSAFAGDAVVGVVPAAPAWTSWPPGDGIVLVGTWRTGSDGSIESRSYRVRLATWTEDGVEPLASEGDRVPHLEAAWLALQGD